jgi:hypothetical protein
VLQGGGDNARPPDGGGLDSFGYQFMRLVRSAYNVGTPKPIDPEAAKVLQQIEDWRES